MSLISSSWGRVDRRGRGAAGASRWRVAGVAVLTLATAPGCDVLLSPDEYTAWKASEAWVTVGAGTFFMGSPSYEVGHETDEALQDTTLTRTFEIGAYEVTQWAFETVMGYNPSWNTPCGLVCPVDEVTWYEAVAMANGLSDAAGLPLCYDCSGEGLDLRCVLDQEYLTPADCDGYRLPTEAEWEYAARAGTGNAFPNGDDLDAEDADSCDDPVVLASGQDVGDFAWYCGNSDGHAHPVGLLDPNAWGLYDVAGNVSEWVDDSMHAYVAGEEDPWYLSGETRIRRGGSWDSHPQYLRLANRDSDDTVPGNSDLGFRLARTLE